MSGYPGVTPPAPDEDGPPRRSYYFAARYNRHPEMRRYRDEMLAELPGAVVTSRWIDCHGGELDASYTPEVLNATPAACWKHGQNDLEDLAAADAIVSFTGDGGGGKGGRHIEHGVAIAYVDSHPWMVGGGGERYRIIIVGPRENIFHCHPATEVFGSWFEFLTNERVLAARAVAARATTACPIEDWREAVAELRDALATIYADRPGYDEAWRP